MGITPITLYFFKTMGVLSFFTNLILTPIGSLFIILGFISIILPEGLLRLFSFFIQGIYNLIEVLLKNFQNISYLTIEIKNEIDFKIIIFIYVVIFIILFKKEIKNLEKNV